MRHRLHLLLVQDCYFCEKATDDFGIVVNDDLNSAEPIIYAVCRSCAISSGMASDDEEWDDELRTRPTMHLMGDQ